MSTTESTGVQLEAFLEGVVHALGKRLDNAQLECVTSAAEESLFIVAGPGSGKTTAIALRILRLIFVDGFDPQAILATTFTNRAAAELRSRVLGWGSNLRGWLATNGHLTPALDDLDLNRLQTGTLDSVAEETLRAYRPAGQAPPVVLEQFQADALMTHEGLFPDGRFRSQSLRDYFASLRGTAWGLDFSGIRAFSSAVRDRMIHDQIDRDAFEAAEAPGNRGVTRLCDVLRGYEEALENELALDFAGLEQRFLAAIEADELNDFAAPLRVLFVDEYQDTNYVQEQIYFGLARRMSTGPSITVVGDDDQALYRFRGATVELFQDYEQRVRDGIGVAPRTIYLASNYRSTESIVAFYDAYVKLDPTYATSRIGDKPDLAARRDPDTYEDVPVLGVFRETLDDVADALAELLNAIVNGTGFALGTGRVVIEKHPDGSIADCAVLGASPREHAYDDAPRLPRLLRDRLEALPTPVRVFNPRGTAFHSIPEVQVLGGLLLECVDPGAGLQTAMTTLPFAVQTRLNEWRDSGLRYAASNPEPRRPRTLQEFLGDWQSRRASDGSAWPSEVPLTELLYKLATWIPDLSAGVEGLVYLEVFGRAVVGATRVVEPFVLSDPTYADGRVRRLIREVFAPLAMGGIDPDEDLFETLPGDRLGILSIHQSKGLEFPLVIVDIGCHYPNNRPGAAQRYPRSPSDAATLEDILRQYSVLESPRRPAMDRTMDDIVRQYFVAFSRAKDVLVLAGLREADTDGPIRRVKNVAAGWTRDEATGSLWDQLPGVVYV